MEANRDWYLDKLASARWSGRVKVLAGIRGCGKSWLLSAHHDRLLSDGVPPERIIRIDLEDSDFRGAADLCRHISREAPAHSGQTYVLIDDIQMLPDFTDAVTTMACRRHLDVCATGRFVDGLLDSVPTECRGRADVIRVHPLGFSEFLSAHPGSEWAAWRDYSEYGGMPGVLREGTAEGKRRCLEGLLEDIVSDMAGRHRVGRPDALSAVVEELRGSAGTAVTACGVSEALRLKGVRIADGTVRRYLGIAADSFLLEEVGGIDLRTWRPLGSPSKFYLEDVGLACFGKDSGHLRAESIIHTELRRRGLSVGTGVRRSVGRRIDFVAERADRRYYIQYSGASDRESREQRKLPFRSLRDGFRRVLILGDDMLPHLDEDGVLNIGMRQFLLDRRSLDYRCWSKYHVQGCEISTVRRPPPAFVRQTASDV